jgi:hypothetical protein
MIVTAIPLDTWHDPHRHVSTQDDALPCVLSLLAADPFGYPCGKHCVINPPPLPSPVLTLLGPGYWLKKSSSGCSTKVSSRGRLGADASGRGGPARTYHSRIGQRQWVKFCSQNGTWVHGHVSTCERMCVQSLKDTAKSR